MLVLLLVTVDHLHRSRSVSCARFRFLKRRRLRMRWISTARRAAPAWCTRHTGVSGNSVSWLRSLSTTTLLGPYTRLGRPYDYDWVASRKHVLYAQLYIHCSHSDVHIIIKLPFAATLDGAYDGGRSVSQRSRDLWQWAVCWQQQRTLFVWKAEVTA